MASVWPWLAVAAAGALHGLNPATGWLLAAAWGVRSRERADALRALLPIGVGHLASVALVAGGVALGVAVDRAVLLAASGVLLLVAVAVHAMRRRFAPRANAPAGHAALALGSFVTSTGHGAGVMLVPVLTPLCAGTAAGGTRAAEPLVLAIAAVGVHAAAMLAVAGAVSLACAAALESLRCPVSPAREARVDPVEASSEPA